MADARPRPRPRPRPVVKAPPVASSSSVLPPSESDHTPSTSTATEVTPTKKAPRVFEDSDDMFIRNKKRSAQDWQKLEKINQEVKTAKRDKGDSSGSSDDDDATPRRRKRVKNESGLTPSWKRTAQMARLLSEDPNSDSDSGSDIEITGVDGLTSDSKKRAGKRKRQKSRSRSITPPPALPAHQIQNAKDFVRQTLQASMRQPSPTHHNSDSDSDEFDVALQPEFAAMAQQIRQQVTSHNPTQPGARSSQTPAPEGVGAEDEVHITVTWIPHPLASNGMSTKWEYSVNRSDNFRDLFEAVSEDATIHVDNLILTHQNKRFFPSITPHTLKIWTDSAEFCAYEKSAYEHIQRTAHTHTHIQHAPPPNHASTSSYDQAVAGPSGSGGAAVKPRSAPQTEAIDIDSGSDSDSDIAIVGATQPYSQSQPQPPPETQTQTQTEDESDAGNDTDASTQAHTKASGGGDTFKLQVQSARTGAKHVTLTVRPTTKCGAIVKAFIKKAGLEGEFPELFCDAAAAAAAVLPPPVPAPATEPEPIPQRGTAKRGRGRGRAKRGGATKAVVPPPPPPPPEPEQAKPRHSGKDPRLCVDGDKLANEEEIGECGLEDGDMVEVVGV